MNTRVALILEATEFHYPLSFFFLARRQAIDPYQLSLRDDELTNQTNTSDQIKKLSTRALWLGA